MTPDWPVGLRPLLLSSSVSYLIPCPATECSDDSPPTVATDLLNAFTVDVEDYFQVSAFETAVPRNQWDRYELRVVRNTQRLLTLLDRYQVKATFFVLGWVGWKSPRLVREIRDAGHEVGCHSFWHRLIYEQSPDEFRQDVQQARDVLQDALGQPVTTYRAPSFSITRRSLWAFDILAEEGFTIDSSVFPTRHDRYGIPDAEPGIHQVATPSGTLREFPPAVAWWGPLKLPVSGGGYFRLYPVGLSLRLLAKINRRYGRPFVFYVHPWEIDPEQPRIAVRKRLSRARHYLNLASTENKLESLLKRFRFAPVEEVVRQDSPAASTGVSRGSM